MNCYRPHIKAAIRQLEADAHGRTRIGCSISITYGKGKFMITLVDGGGIKEGWLMTWYPYTQKSVNFLRDVIVGKKI